jgi:hypothetical protein
VLKERDWKEGGARAREKRDSKDKNDEEGRGRTIVMDPIALQSHET